MPMSNWSFVNEWRRLKRAELLTPRLAMPRAERTRRDKAIAAFTLEQLAGFKTANIGFYWPFRGEPDLRRLVRSLLDGGATASLPVVIDKNRPLEFWSWRTGERLRPGVWDIPVPARRKVARPDVLLVPLLGFDEAGYRLGNGGGYYDRTLAAPIRRPFTIGVGYELGRLKSIRPQPHDIPMDVIVTEMGATSSPHRSDATRPAERRSNGTRAAARRMPVQEVAS